MVTVYEGMLALLDKFGFFNIILPWILVYAITFGILLRTQIFGNPFDTSNKEAAKNARTLSSLVALSVASLVIGSYQAVTNIRNIVPLFALFILIVVCLIIVIAAFTLPEGAVTGQDTLYTKYKKFLAIPASIIFILVLLNYFGFLSGGGTGIDWQSFLDENKEIVEAAIILAFFGLIVWWTVREPKEKRREQSNNTQQ